MPTMTDCSFFSMRNFEEFQEFKYGKPLQYIKLHRHIASQYEFSSLSKSSQRDLIMLWLLAADTKNKIRNDQSYLKRKLDSDTDIDINALFHANFIIHCDEKHYVKHDVEHDVGVTRQDKTTNKTRQLTKQRTKEVPPYSNNGKPPKGSQLPTDFALTPEMEAYAKSKGIQDVATEFEHFTSYHLAHGKIMKSWPAAWRTWCLNFAKFKPRGTVSGDEDEGERKKRAWQERNRQATLEALERLKD